MRTPDAPDYEIDSEPNRLDLDLVHRWLSLDSYWAAGRSRDMVERAATNSLNFGVYTTGGQQVGYARVVTDSATFGWLCDVYIDPEHRVRGLGTRLARAVVDHLEPFGLKRLILATADAHDVYARAEFVPLPDPHKFMVHSQPS